ncbi:TPA: polysaccharide biosynthesis protein, partial [Streptococcus suis]
MTVEDYGLMNNFTAMASILSVVVGLSLNGAISTAKFDYSAKFEAFKSSILFLSSISFFIFLLLGNIYLFYTGRLFGFNSTVFNYLIFQSYSLFIVQFISNDYTIQNKPVHFL